MKKLFAFILCFMFMSWCYAQPFSVKSFANVETAPQINMPAGHAFFGVHDSLDFYYQLVGEEFLPIDGGGNVSTFVGVFDSNNDLLCLYNEDKLVDASFNTLVDSVNFAQVSPSWPDYAFMPNNIMFFGTPIFELDSIIYFTYAYPDYTMLNNYNDNLSPSLSSILPTFMNSLPTLPLHYYVQRVDFGANGLTPLGVDTLLKSDTSRLSFASNLFALNRHANGRDWWFINRDGLRERFYVQLITPYGIDDSQSQIIDIDTTFCFLYRHTNINFNNKGDRFSMVSYHDGISFYDFDRCNGSITKVNKTSALIPVPIDEILQYFPDAYNGVRAQGVSVRYSPNDEYLYIRMQDTIFQMDLSLPYDQMYEEKDVIAIYETANSTDTLGYANYFVSDLMGAPGVGRYIVSAGGATFSSISNLNAPADSVIFEHQIFQVPQFFWPNANSIRTDNTNYALFDIEGSICDSLGINGPPQGTGPTAIKPSVPKLKDIQMWPNPVADVLTLRGNSGQGDVHVQICDLLGKSVTTSFWPNGVIKYPIDVSSLPPQTYFLTLTDVQGNTLTKKVVVVR